MAIQFIVGDDAGEAVSGSTPLQVQVTITEGDFNSDGQTDLRVDLEVVSGFEADLRGFFFNVSNDALLSQLTVTGADINGAPVFDTDGDGIPEIDSASPPPPEAQITPLAFEAGLELGTPGISTDDIGSTSFIISGGTTPLTYDLLAGQAIGIRAQSVGEDREGSSKLTGTVPPPPPEPGTISGHKFEDMNGDGNWDPGEGGVPNWTVSLYNDANGDGIAQPGELVGNTTTDFDGGYSFTGLAAGDYLVVEGAIPGWLNTSPTLIEVDDLDAGETSENNDFFNALAGSITGHKYNDLDGDGNLDPGEPGLAGWTITLFKDGVEVATAITGPDGWYSFAGLLPGNYTTVETLQDGWEQTLGSSPETLTSAEHDIEGNDFLNTMEEDPPPPPPSDGGFHKDLDITVDIDLNMDLDIYVEVESNTLIVIDVASDAEIEGNIAQIALDAEAIGEDTFVDVAMSVLSVENELSSISAEVFSTTT
jgi:hypothetical protein